MFEKITVLLCLWLSACANVAVAGTPAADAWFVRPASVCPTNGDGLGYECALSPGAHGSFSGLDNIRWEPLSGVDDGDTMYVCGDHNKQLSVSATGSALAPVNISGDCPGDRGSINTAGGGALDSAVLLLNVSHIRVSGFAQLTGNRAAILVYASSGPMEHITINRNVIDNRLSASTTNVCNGIGFDGTFPHVAMTITHNTILGTATDCGGTSNNDGINMIRLTSGLIAWNDISGAEGGIDFDGTLEGVDVYGNWVHDNRVDGMKAFGGHACPIGPARVQQNLFVNNGNWGVIWQNQRNSLFADNVIVQFRDTPQSGSAPYGGLQTEDPTLFTGATCPSANNTFLGNIITANWQYGVVTHYSQTRAEFDAGHVWQGNLLYQNGTQTPLVWFGPPLAPTSQVNEGNYAAWQTGHKGDLNAAPQFVDASACVSQASVAACQAADFHLTDTSQFKNDGPWWGKDCVGVNGKICVSPVRTVRSAPPVTIPTASYSFSGTITGPIMP